MKVPHPVLRLTVLGMALLLGDNPRAVGQRGGGPGVPVRDMLMPSVGTAAIDGVVVVDGPDRVPLRRATVVLRGTEVLASRVATTDDQGHFAFVDLPAGRFTLTVSKAGYVSTAYGARSPGGPGTPIAIRDGANATGLVVPIARGAVITGRIVDETGRPATGHSVSVIRQVMVNGQPTSSPAFYSGIDSDDRGVYRVFGLPAGSYIVAVSRFASSANLPRVTTQAEVDWARSAARGAGPGLVAQSSVAPSRGPVLNLVPVFFPGTTDAALAERVTVASGQERTGIDFVVRMVPTATVTGTVRLPDGQPAQSLPVTAVNLALSASRIGLLEIPGRAVAARTGEFSLGGLAPGRYMLTVRGSSGTIAPTSGPPGGRGGAAPVMDLWAQEEIVVMGEDISNVRLQLAPGMTVTGRVAFDGTKPQPEATSARIAVTPPPTGTATVGLASGQVSEDGTFKLAGLAPGPYLMSSSLLGGTPANPVWMLKSILVDGRDVLDAPLDVRPGIDVDNVVVTFTDRVTRISGTLTDQEGRPAPDYFVLVFSTKPETWYRQSRWLRAPLRPATDGSFALAALPPGEYYMAALTEFEQNEWFTPAFLQLVVPGALRVTLGEGEQKTQDIRLALP